MPYVEGFGTWPFGEEWLWEAVAGVYLPLLDAARRARRSRVSLTPVLCDQLEAHARRGRRALPALPARDPRADPRRGRGAGSTRSGEPELAAELRRAAGDYARADERFERRGRDLLGALRRRSSARRAVDVGRHPRACCRCWPPTPGLRLQLATGVAAHERRFGGWGGGFWLPECAYAPGLERDLAEHGVRVFCVDQTEALGLGALDHLEPVATEAGPVAVPIDWQTVELVWDDRAATPRTRPTATTTAARCTT